MQKRINQKGFTLVELVVVIAVLAILAGVGVVAYNGYIEKAREAADQELLGAVNTAFASACAETGVEGHPAEANASLMHKKVNQVTADDISGFNDAFFMYFEGNEGKEFQVVEGLIYNKAGGFFYASLNGGIRYFSETVTLSLIKERMLTAAQLGLGRRVTRKSTSRPKRVLSRHLMTPALART